jgi:hypothetical protein
MFKQFVFSSDRSRKKGVQEESSLTFQAILKTCKVTSVDYDAYEQAILVSWRSREHGVEYRYL